MRKRVLLTGAAGLLGRHVVAQRLLGSQDEVFCMAADAGAPDSGLAQEHLLKAVLELMPPGQDIQQVRPRLHGVEPSFLRSGRADEIWHIGEGQELLRPARRLRRALSATRELLDAAPSLGVEEFNYVSTLFVAGSRTEVLPEAPREPMHAAHHLFGELHRVAEREVVERCGRHGIGFRLFRPSLMVGDAPRDEPMSREGLQGLMWVLAELVQEVQDRLPEYFEYCALRYFVPEGAGFHLLRAGHAARVLCRIAAQPTTLGGVHPVVSPERTRIVDLFNELGRAYGVGLLKVPEQTSLNPIDRLFHERLGAFHDGMALPWNPAWGRTLSTAGIDPAELVVDTATRWDLFRSHRRAQVAGLGAQRERMGTVLTSLERKTLPAPGGAGLTYYVGGREGIPLVILNALGQGLHYWTPLVHQLMQRYRVLLWEPRGTRGTESSFRLGDQVDDLEAILRNEDVRSCRLCAWCTGPKVAVELYARRPELVASMVFLMGAFKPFEGKEGLNTPYEQTLEPICHILARRPEAAGSVIRSLQASVTSSVPEAWQGLEPQSLGAMVLGMMNRELKPHVMAPFQDGPTVVRYAHQLLDFWSHAVETRAPEVKVPVLLVGAEYDRIASPEISRAAARRFPASRYVQLRGATHYAFYDRPALVAELMETFFEEPEALRETSGEVILETH
jgi:pimeloyl-ACP methyl ester carboxylesterase/nucleoside-diphosphate-sugar epimerase